MIGGGKNIDIAHIAFPRLMLRFKITYMCCIWNKANNVSALNKFYIQDSRFITILKHGVHKKEQTYRLRSQQRSNEI